jgi:DNA-3-methyladenine glycosylase I
MESHEAFRPPRLRTITAAMSAILHPDGRYRCPWPKQDPLYVAYHDDEWGVPERDDRALFEKLVLDGFQAGLSWITILRKRDNFRRAFDGFAPEAIAGYGKRKVTALMNDAGIVRNRAKIEGTILSARGYLDVMEKGPGFSGLLWNFVDGTVRNACNSSRSCRLESLHSPDGAQRNPGTPAPHSAALHVGDARRCRH